MVFHYFSFLRIFWRLALLSTALYLSPSAFSADLQIAITAFNEAHYSKAKQLFELASKDAATKNDAFYYLSRIAILEGDADKAKGYLDQSVSLEPNASDEYYLLAVVYGELARKVNVFQRASYASNVHKYYQLAVDADPKNIAARRGLFLFYVIAPSIMGGGIDKAEKTLSDIRKLSPVDADIEQLDWYSRKEESEKQLAQAKLLIASYPNSAEALFKAAHTFRNQQKLDSAITGFELAARLPITVQNRMFVETSIFQFGETCQWASVRTDDAIVNVEKYIALKTELKGDDLNWPRWTLAKLYYQKGDMEKFQSLRKQLDPEFLRLNKWMKEDIEKFDKSVKSKN